MGNESIVTSDYKIKSNTVTSDLVTKRDKHKYSAAKARQKAMYIAEKLKNPSRMRFYLKCAWNLNDAYLDRLLDIASSKDDPQRYFSKSASEEIKSNG